MTVGKQKVIVYSKNVLVNNQQLMVVVETDALCKRGNVKDTLSLLKNVL